MDKQELTRLLMGNEAASAFCEKVFQIAYFWDDLIDRDKELSDDEINSAMTTAVLDLPIDPFYSRHAPFLYPVLRTALMNWRTATNFERSGDEYEHRIAYVIRSSYATIVAACAFVIGGEIAAQSVNDKIWHLFPREGFDEYRTSLVAEKIARES